MVAGDVLAVWVVASSCIDEIPRLRLVRTLDPHEVHVALIFPSVKDSGVVVNALECQHFLLSALEQLFMQPLLPLFGCQVFAVLNCLHERSHLPLVLPRSALHAVSLPLPLVEPVRPVEEAKPHETCDDLGKATRHFLVIRSEEVGPVAVVVSACTPVRVVIAILVEDAVLVHLVHLAIATTDYIIQGRRKEA